MGKKLEDLGEVQLYFVDDSTIEKVEGLFPISVAEQIKRGEVFGLAIEEEGEIRGALGAVFDPDSVRLEIVSLYVAEEARRRRLGATLLLQTIETVMEETGGELRAVTMSFLEGTKGIRELLEQVGFKMETLPEEGSFFLDRQMLERSILNQKKESLFGQASGMVLLEALTEYEKKELFRQLEKEGVAYLGAKELEKARRDLSFIRWDSGHEIQACCILSGNSQLVLSQFYSRNGNMKYGIEVLLYSLSVLLEKEESWKLEIPCVSSSAIRLLEKLVPEAEKENYIRAVLWM